MGIGKRIRSYRKEKGLKVKELAQIIGISQGSLSDIENEKTKPSADTLSSIVRNTDINPYWLLTGKGPMLKEGDHLFAHQGLNPQVVKDVIETLEELLEREKVHLPPSKKAELVVLLAEEVQEEEQELSPGRILRLIKLAS